MSVDRDAVTRMLAGYEPIIRRFISGESSADQFETEFLSYFKSDNTQIRGDEFDVLDGLFGDVDEYVGDPDLRAATGGLGEDDLRVRAGAAFRCLFGA